MELKGKYPPPFRPEESEASILHNMTPLGRPSLKQQESDKSKGPRFSSVGSIEERSSGISRFLGRCFGLRRLKPLKMRVSFGMGATQEYDKKFIKNYVSTTKSSLFNF